jgi:hypothetical protein
MFKIIIDLWCDIACKWFLLFRIERVSSNTWWLQATSSWGIALANSLWFSSRDSFYSNNMWFWWYALHCHKSQCSISADINCIFQSRLRVTIFITINLDRGVIPIYIYIYINYLITFLLRPRFMYEFIISLINLELMLWKIPYSPVILNP